MAGKPRLLRRHEAWSLPPEPKIQTAFWLGSEDFELFDLIRARYCLATRAAALRFVLRWWKARVAGDAAEGR